VSFRILSNWHHDESGPTSAEYAVLLALILMAVILAITSVGNSSSSMWDHDVKQITSAIGS
jgi:pilus assembly protein Flp/PilA